MKSQVMQMVEKYSKITMDKSTGCAGWEMLKMHAHNDHELYFLVEGKRRYFIEDTLFDVTTNDLILIPKTKLHRTLINGDGKHTRYVVYFDHGMVQTLIDRVGAEAFEKLMQCSCLQLPPEAARQIRSKLNEMYLQQRTPDEYSHVVNTYLLENILLLAIRYGTPKQPIAGKGISKMQEVAHYINKNLALPISLKDAAEIAHMEATYFSKSFKAATGEGFQEYLTKVRLRKAEQLLAHSDMLICEIAGACGFSTANHFSDVFRRWNGVSPTQYRKHLKNHRL